MPVLSCRLFAHEFFDLLHIFLPDGVEGIHAGLLVVVDPDMVFDAAFAVNGGQGGIPVVVVNISFYMRRYGFKVAPVEFHGNLEVFHEGRFGIDQGAVGHRAQQKVFRDPDQPGVGLNVFSRQEGNAFFLEMAEDVADQPVIVEVFDPDAGGHGILEKHFPGAAVEAEAVLLLYRLYRPDDELVGIFCFGEQKDRFGIILLRDGGAVVAGVGVFRFEHHIVVIDAFQAFFLFNVADGFYDLLGHFVMGWFFYSARGEYYH